MSSLNVTNILFPKPLAKFTEPIDLQITFEVLTPLKHEITWK